MLCSYVIPNDLLPLSSYVFFAKCKLNAKTIARPYLVSKQISKMTIKLIFVSEILNKYCYCQLKGGNYGSSCCSCSWA